MTWDLSRWFLAKAPTLSELESAMTDIFRLVDLSTDSIVDSSAGERNIDFLG